MINIDEVFAQIFPKVKKMNIGDSEEFVLNGEAERGQIAMLAFKINSEIKGKAFTFVRGEKNLSVGCFDLNQCY